MKIEHAKTAWVIPRLGRHGDLLYMGPLLRGISKIYSSFNVFTVEYGGDNNAGIDITCSGSIKIINHDVNKDGVETAIPLVSPAIIRKLYQYKPDLLILNEFGMLTMYCVLLSLILPRTKILIIVENRPILLASPMSKKIRGFIRRLIAKRADALLTNNEDGKSYLIQDLHVDESRIVCRPYLVSDMSQNMESLATPPLNTSIDSDTTKRTRFVFVGRLIQLKGLQHALEAFQRLMEMHPREFIFDIVGDGPYRSTLESQTKELGLTDHVYFHGRQSYESLTQTYQNADAFLFPTLMDYRSLVCFEAMSVGLPIIASIHDGGSIETVDEGKNGYTFDPLDYAKLAEILSRFIEHPEIIKTFSARSQKMSENYTLPRAVESVALASNLALQSLNN